MGASDLKQWMTEHDKLVADVASATRISVNTVYKYLRGEVVSKSVAESLRRLVADSEKQVS